MLAPDDLRHGTLNGYVNLKCRCRACGTAHNEFTWAARRRRHARMLSGESHPEHGKTNTYVNWLCRCPACREAHSKAYRERR